tara:strand:+ start:29919 stop:31352 length:1434 start_codon:yes stop_codon:yes gene_type:complete
MGMTRAAVLQFFHEANAFSPLRVTRDEFLTRHHLSGQAVRDAFATTSNWMGGVLTALEQREIETEIGLCTAALPGGALEADAWAQLRSELLESLWSILEGGPVSHLFVLLHGALAVEGVSDPEGALVAEIRQRLGARTRITTTLDFHANISPRLQGASDVIVSGKLYPHTDTRERGALAVRFGLATDELKTWHFNLGLSVPMPNQATTEGPFARLADLSDTFAALGGVEDVNIIGGFPFSTEAYAGTSLLVTGTERHAARAVYERVLGAVEEARGDLLRPVPSPTASITRLRERLGSGRLILVDVGDNPGGGGLGDRTELIAELEALGRPYAFGALVRPDLVKAAQAVGTGGTVDVPSGREKLSCTVASLAVIRYRNAGDMMRGEEVFGGDGAVLFTPAGSILVSSLRIQAYDRQAFESMNLTLHDYDIIAIKSIAHFRSSYADLATGGIILTDSGGWSSHRRRIEWERGRIQMAER